MRNVNEVHMFDSFVNYILLRSVIEFVVRKKREVTENLGVLMGGGGRGVMVFKTNSSKRGGGPKNYEFFLRRHKCIVPKIRSFVAAVSCTTLTTLGT